MSTFVGRQHELGEIRRLFEKASLVTLTGPGGVGKTRLATRAAAGMLKAFPQGVWFVALAEVGDPDLIPQTIADGLGGREPDGAADLDRLVDYVADRRLLLVLDNGEHLIEQVAVVADALRRSCPGLAILVTSREPLGVAGEAILPVPPLPVPDPGGSHPLDGLPRFDSVALFADRASAVMPDFALTEQNQQSVLQIVTQLDGLPLALELAAARLRTLSASELAERLSNRYQLLTTGHRVGPERHQTLRFCVDWSYSLCTAREQCLWARLSVFVGTFTLETIREVCAFGDVEPDEVLDLVGSLIDKSVLSRTVNGDTTRFHLLESLREYGLERLRESGEYDELVIRHLHRYSRIAEVFRGDWIKGPQVELAARVGLELPNLRAAFETALTESVDSRVALTMTDSLHTFWIARGLITEGRHWASRALAGHDGSASIERLRVLFCAVTLAGLQGDHAEANELVQESQRLGATLDDDMSAAILAHTLGSFGTFGSAGPGEVLDSLTRAVDGYRECGDELRFAAALVQLALGAFFTGQFDLAKTRLEELVEIPGNGEVLGQAYAKWIGGLVAWREGQFEQAVESEREAVRLREVFEDTIGLSWGLEALGFIAVSTGEHQRAAMLFGAAKSLAQEVTSRSTTFPGLVPAYLRSTEAARAALGDNTFDVLFERGRALDHEAAIALALGEKRRRPTDPPTTDSPLTQRESEVASLVAEGLTNKAIAARLVISQRTAQGHVENILTKLGFNSRAQIAAWVADNDPAK